LGEKRRKEVRRKVCKKMKMLQEYSRGVAFNQPLLAREGRGRWRGCRGLAGRSLPVESPRHGSPTGVFVVELGACSASRRARRPSSSRSREEDASASPPVGWSGKANSSSSKESESTTVLSECLRQATRAPDLALSLSRSSEASGPTPLAAESCSELAVGALGRGPGMTLSARKGPQALNFKIPAVTRLVSRAPRL
jgi:hypothetical protein